MAFDPVKGQYLKVDSVTNSCAGLSNQHAAPLLRYVGCDMPHDPIEYPLVVNTGASLVGQTDEDGTGSGLVQALQGPQRG